MIDPTIRATTVALPEPPDLLALAGEDGWLFRDEHGGLAGQGVAASIDLPDGLSGPGAATAVSRALEAIDCDDAVGRPGTGPVAMGALPFDPGAPGRLVIPRRVFGRHHDKGWVTTVDPADGIAPPAGPSPPADRPSEPPDEFRLCPTMSHQQWKRMVADAVAMLTAGEMAKVVLARRIDITANRAFVISDVLERLIALYPSCMVFSMGGFLGASPELLIRREGDRVESHPLAGTVARSGDVDGDRALVAGLMGSAKNRREHRVVVDALAAALAPLCAALDVPDTPSILGLRNVSHLATRITGRLSPGGPSALELVARVHPTPAVAGTPTADAVGYIQKVEGFDRGCYTGPVGWMDGRGDGVWAIGIRSAEVSGRNASIFAGNGIVAGSDPADELAETQLKLQALLAALVRP